MQRLEKHVLSEFMECLMKNFNEVQKFLFELKNILQLIHDLWYSWNYRRRDQLIDAKVINIVSVLESYS